MGALLGALLGAFLGGLLGALHCASPAPPAPAAAATESCMAEAVTVTLAAGAQLNDNSGGPGLPVAVRMYQLQRDSRLRNAAFDAVWQDDKSALKEDLLAVEEHTAYPGQEEQFRLALHPDAIAIAAVALFRQPQGNDWFVIFDLRAQNEKPPCPVAEPVISVWVDRTKIQDGQGHELGASAAPPLHVRE
jgi:type VI secretion system VasD/TssJ family lipoprotein